MKKILLLLSITIFIACDEDNTLEPLELEPVEKEFFRDSLPTIELNKSGITPLVATVTVEPRINARAGFRVLTNPNAPNYESWHFSNNLTPGSITEIHVIGLYPGVKNKVEINYIDNETDNKVAYDTLEITTEPLPDFFPDVEIKTDVPRTLITPELSYLCTFVNGKGPGDVKTYPFIFDKNGDIRWYANLEEWGNLLLPGEPTEENTIIFGYANKIREIHLAGNLVVDITVNDVNVHHDVIKHNGNYIAAVDVFDRIIKHPDGSEYTTIEDHIIEYTPSGNEVNRWDLTEILDIDRHDVVEDNVDWFHMNAITYDPNDETLIVSGRNQGVIKVDWDNNLKWILAPHQGWGNAGWDGSGADTRPFLLKAIDGSGNEYSNNIQQGVERAPDFDWSWTQHDPQVLPNGNIIIFDNGANRQFLNPNPANIYSRIVEYDVDEENMTVQQKFEYGRERGEDLYSVVVSSVSYFDVSDSFMLSSGITSGLSDAHIVEVDRNTGDVLFEAVCNFNNPLNDGQFNFGTFDLIYRTNKILLY